MYKRQTASWGQLRRRGAAHRSNGHEVRVAEPRSGRSILRVNDHRGQQQAQERKKRHERSATRKDRGELRGDGGDQHEKEQRSPAPRAGPDRRSPSGRPFGDQPPGGRPPRPRSPGGPVRRCPFTGRPACTMPLCLVTPHTGPQPRASRLRGIGRIRRTPTC